MRHEVDGGRERAARLAELDPRGDGQVRGGPSPLLDGAAWGEAAAGPDWEGPAGCERLCVSSFSFSSHVGMLIGVAQGVECYWYCCGDHECRRDPDTLTTASSVSDIQTV